MKERPKKKKYNQFDLLSINHFNADEMTGFQHQNCGYESETHSQQTTNFTRRKKKQQQRIQLPQLQSIETDL